MQTAVYGSYSNGIVTLDETPKDRSEARVVVLFVEEDCKEGSFLKENGNSLMLSRKKKNGVLTKNDFSPAFIDTKNWRFNREEANVR